MQLHWLQQFEFAGFYIAKEKGFYADVGLDVEILPYLRGETDVVQSVLSGSAQYGINYSSLLYDYHAGKPVVALSAIFQDSPLILLSIENKGIETPSDLRNKRVMIGGDALNAAPVLALLFQQGLKRSDIVKVPHSYDIEDLISGHTDAMTAYISNEPFHLQTKGLGYKVFDPKESGLSFYGNILFTSKSVLEQNPDQTARFVGATLKGWTYAFDHIDETVDLILAKYNEQNKSREALMFEAQALKKLALKKGIPLGFIDRKKLEKTEDAYRLMGIQLSDQPLRGFLWMGGGRPGDATPVFTKEELAFIENSVVKAATTTNWPPFSFTERQSGSPAGIGYDFWSEIVQTAGLTDRITPFKSFAAELESIRNKEQDVIYSVGMTEERKGYSLFTEPYASFPLAIATSKDENFLPDATYLKGKRIAIGRNFTAHKMMVDAFPDFDYLPVANVEEGLKAVTRGEAYAIVDIMPVLAHSINRLGFTNIKISGETGLAFDLRVMIRDDYPELLSIANKVIATLGPAKRQEIMNRWINVQYQQGFDYSAYLPYFLLALLIAAGAFYWMHHAKRQAQRANRAKSEFLALMSHDLRTPLNAIMGMSDMMRNHIFGPMGSPRYEEYAEDIHKSGELLVNLINDILDLSKIEAGKYKLADETVDVENLIRISLNQCSVLAHPLKVTVVPTIAEDFPNLRGDARVLVQILNNLISNAIKFSHEGGVVTVTAGRGMKGGIFIAISDNGIGMSRQEVMRVLKPFEQADRNHARRNEGTGLGLYVCFSLMRLFSGKLEIESAPGNGTTVTIRFPVDRTVSKEADAAHLGPQLSGHSN